MAVIAARSRLPIKYPGRPAFQTRRSASSRGRGASAGRFLIRPDGEFIAVWIAKVQAPPAGEREGGTDDGSAGCSHGLLGLLEVGAVEDDEGRACRGM